MDRSAVLHIPMSQYAYMLDEERMVFRLRTKREDLDGCFLYYGDRACRQTPVHFERAAMTVAAQDEMFDYYEVTLKSPYRRICYYFELFFGTESLLYYGDFFSDRRVDDRSEYYQFPYMHRADLVRPPEWAQDAVIYNIFPDSFADGLSHISQRGQTCEFAGKKTVGKRGGTLKGILENAAYLESLGITAIYLNPIFAAGEYHKYDLLDYFHVDPCFGTNEEFKELVEGFHAYGIRVIIDGVFNHCGWQFPMFEDVIEKGEDSAYRDWFYSLRFPVVRPQDAREYPSYECFGYERMMPKLATDREKVAEYFCEVCRYWLSEFGIDGWRLDVASEVNDGFWRQFYRAAKSVNPQAILIGEIWESANHWLDGTIFDSTMNYDFRKHCRRFFAEKSIDAKAFDGRMTNMRMRYRKQSVFAQLNLLDSHDVSRFLSLCGGDREVYTLAVVFQMTFPGMPCIFYGDEKGVEGMTEDAYRQAMPWEKEDRLTSFFRKAIRLRREEEALRRGSFWTVSARQGSGLYVYAREWKRQRILVALNREERPARLSESWLVGEVLWERGLQGCLLQPNGFAVLKKGEK